MLIIIIITIIIFLTVGILNKSSIFLLVEIALRLTKDGEKVRSHARLSLFSHKNADIIGDTTFTVENVMKVKLLVYALKRVVLILILIFIQVKSNAVRALGYLSRFLRFNHQADTINDQRLHNILCALIAILFASYFNLQFSGF